MLHGERNNPEKLSAATAAYQAMRVRDPKDRALEFLREEDEMSYHVGCPDLQDLAAFVWTIEAARHLCAAERRGAAMLLRRAAAALELRTTATPEDELAP